VQVVCSYLAVVVVVRSTLVRCSCLNVVVSGWRVDQLASRLVTSSAFFVVA
jgi:hypothetical protein